MLQGLKVPWPPAVVNLHQGCTSLAAWVDSCIHAGLFDLAHVLVTNDSGPAHFAALTRIREVVFFGPEIPDRYRPLTTNSDVIHTGYSCSPCIGPLNQRRSPCNDNLCLKSISIDEIAVLVRSRLEAVRSSDAPVDGAR